MAFANRGALEGFICPDCMVKFPSDARVRAHWIEFHSGVKKRETPDRENERAQDGIPMSRPLQRAPEPKNPKGIRSHLRHIIAKGRGRYIDNTFDLDLTYITERIIAMSFPATGLESTYRNNLEDVAKMLKQKHEDKYMVFNLSERSYDVSKLNHQVLDFGWPDHLAPPLDRLCSICKSIDSWLASDPQHVVVVHCKGGKGRTGVVISAYMHYSNLCTSAEDALDQFAMKRFYDDKLGGVTQPSQRRYVHYFEDLLKKKIRLTDGPIFLQTFIVHGTPNFDSRGGCKLFLKIYQNLNLIHTTETHPSSGSNSRILIAFPEPLELSGDILVKGFHKSLSNRDAIFRCQFHTCAVTEFVLVFSKSELDEAYRDKRFPDSSSVEFIFSPPLIDLNKGETVHRALQRSSDSVARLQRSSSYEKMSQIERAQPDGESAVTGTPIPNPEHYAGPVDQSLYAAIKRIKLQDGKIGSQSPRSVEKRTMSEFEKNWHRRLVEAGLDASRVDADVRMSSNAVRIANAEDDSGGADDDRYYGTVAFSPEREIGPSSERKSSKDYTDVPPIFVSNNSDSKAPPISQSANSFDGWFKRFDSSPSPSDAPTDWLIPFSPNKSEPKIIGGGARENPLSPDPDEKSCQREFRSPDTLSNVTFDNVFVPPNREEASKQQFFSDQWGSGRESVASPVSTVVAAAAERPRPIGGVSQPVRVIGLESVPQGVAAERVAKEAEKQKPSLPPRSPGSVNMGKQFWYKPRVTKMEADKLLQNCKPGSFVIRDSNSRPGSYSLVMKTTQSYVDPASQKSGAVKHFLIVTENGGLKLFGSDEPVFNSLIQFVLEHSINPLQLPCKLVIPMKDLSATSLQRRSPARQKPQLPPRKKVSPQMEIINRGAACDVLYLMSTEVSLPTSGRETISMALADYVVRSPFITPTLVHFKANVTGILLTGTGKSGFFRKHYPIRSILFCLMDDTKTQVRPWVGELNHEGTSTTRSIFGIVSRRPGTTDRYGCHLFAEYDDAQPSNAIVTFVNQIMKVTATQFAQ